MELTRNQAENGDRLLEKLCEEYTIRNSEVIHEIFGGKDEAEHVGVLLRDAGLLSIDAQTENDLLYQVSRTTKTCRFLEEGGLVKEFEKGEKLRRQEHYEYSLSRWKYKTFWPLLIFGLFGGVYSMVDAIRSLTTIKDEEVVISPKEEQELEQSKPHTSTSDQKKDILSTQSN